MMETKEYRTFDKTDWEDGPWNDEPDKMQWPDSATGLPCLIVRGPMGALCGYVGVPNTHPWHGKGYSEERVGPCGDTCEDDAWHYLCSPEGMITVHGGLTFSGVCQETDDETTGICHVPGDGEPDNIWWFGFDCGHSGDIMPKPTMSHWSGLYRNVEYVKREVTRLAAQLALVADEV